MKFSIIVPVYNVEKYLAKCIDSIVDQTFKDFELILIDDGSVDESPNICDKYLRKYTNIKVVHKKNEGQGAAWMKEEFFLLLNIVGLAIVGFFSAAGAIVRLTEYLVSCTYIFLIPECLNRITSRNNSKFIVAIIIFILTYLHLKIILGPVDFIF